MAKITYLLGAGASYDALPTVDNFNEELQSVIHKTQDWINSIIKNGIANFEWEERANVCLSDLKFLLEGCRRELSPDTFARKLFHREDITKYRLTKCAITLFFELYKFYKNSYDKRYSAFIASIIQGANSKSTLSNLGNYNVTGLSNKINIISWNYDYEFEKAYMEYMQDCQDIHDVYSELKVIHKNGHQNIMSFDSNFGIIKVNGTIGYFDSNAIKLGIQPSNTIISGEQKLVEVLNLHYKYVHHEKPLESAISFAWEEETKRDTLLDKTNHFIVSTFSLESKIQQAINSSVMGTDIIIVIGYSFPDFNRSIDKQIFANASKHNTKIFIQDLNPENIHEELRELGFTGNNVFYKKNVKRFFIPDEFHS